MTLGGTPVEPAILTWALARCERDAPELSASECLRQRIAPGLRLGREVARRGLEQSDAGRHITARVLFEALYRQIEQGLPPASDEQIAAYLQAHRRDFEAPERFRLFRILVTDRERAKALLEGLGSDTTVAQFRELCRKHTSDDATRERGGDLGFVWPDGTTDVPQLRADAGLYAAASTIPDGGFVPEPVAEGEQFAVVWRRGTLPARSVAPERARALAQERLRAAQTTQKLGDLVRAADSSMRPELLAKLQRPECKIWER